MIFEAAGALCIKELCGMFPDDYGLELKRDARRKQLARKLKVKRIKT